MLNKKVCLINPPVQIKQEKYEEWSNNSIFNFQYLGIAYLEAILKKESIEVEVFDCPPNNISIRDLKERLLDNKYNYIGISVFYYNLFNFERLNNFIKQYLPDSFVFIGGYAATMDYENILLLHRNIKCVLLGEGEYTILELVQRLQENDNWKNTPGIAYLYNHKIYKNNINHIVNLNTLPEIIHKKYRKCQTIAMLTSRGCYGSCSFCSEKRFLSFSDANKMRFRTIESVLNEIKHISSRIHPRYISFCDSDFMPSSKIRKEWILQFLLLLKEQKFDIEFNALLRANDILYYEDLLQLFKEVGFKYFFVGIESFVDRQLKFYKKNITSDINKKGLKIICQHGFDVELGFLIIEPTTSICEIKENIISLQKLDIFAQIHYNQAFFSIGAVLYSIKGTDIFDYVKSHNLYANNSIGYKFQDSDVEEYYESLCVWQKNMEQYNYIKFLIDKAIAQKDNIAEKKLKKCLCEIRCLDLEYMYYLTENLKNKEKIENGYKKYSLKIKEKVINTMGYLNYFMENDDNEDIRMDSEE